MKSREYYQEIQELILTLRYKEYSKLMENIERIISTYEDHDEAIFLLGHYAYALGNYELALEYFTSSWKLNKTIKEYADAIAITYIALNEKDKALSYSKTSEFLRPHQHIEFLLDPNIMNYQGLHDDENIRVAIREIRRKFVTGRYYACINLSMKILHSAKNDPALFLYLGKSYYNLYEYELAYQALKISYENTEDNFHQLRLLIELSLKLSYIDEFKSYVKQLSTDSQDLTDKIQVEILNYYAHKDSHMQKKINSLAKDKENIRENAINNKEYLCNLGIIINNRMDQEYLSLLLSFIVIPDDFNIIIYDIDSENLAVKTQFELKRCKYRNLYKENYQSSAMLIRGEGLHILIDATYESAKNSHMMYSYDNIVKTKISLFDAEVKPLTNKILLSDNNKILDLENTYNIDQFFAFPTPNYERYMQAPMANTQVLSIGVIADKRNINADFLNTIADILQGKDNTRIIFGYKDYLDQNYKQEVISYFNNLNLLDKIFFLEQDDKEQSKRDLKDEFFGYIDVLLNGEKVYPQAMAISLYMGVPVYYISKGLSNDSLAISILSSMESYENYIYKEDPLSLKKCVKDILQLLDNQENLSKVREYLISEMPHATIFKKQKSNLLFYENILELKNSLELTEEQV